MGTGSECTHEVPVPISEAPISEANRVTLCQTKGTGTSLRSGASPLCLAQALRCAREPVPFVWPRHFAALGSQSPLSGPGTSLRSGASSLCLALSQNDTALFGGWYRAFSEPHPPFCCGATALRNLKLRFGRLDRLGEGVGSLGLRLPLEDLVHGGHVEGVEVLTAEVDV
jgi:hypothetical protein